METIKGVKIIENGRISSVPVDISFDGGVITQIERSGCGGAEPLYVSMGFIDIHTHGGGGHDVSECTADALNAIGNYHLKRGVTAYLPAFVASPLSVLDDYFEKLRSIQADGAEILGAHIEGPYISPEKKGAQPIENILTVYDDNDKGFFERNSDILKIVTLCPATQNAPTLVKRLAENGIKAQAGHDNSFDFQIEACMAEGLDGVTHLYNASSGIRRASDSVEKRLGLNETALLHDALFCEVIADNVHIPPRLFKLIYKNKDFKRIILISDSLSIADAPDGRYFLGGDIEIISDGRVAYLKDKSAIAGSVTSVSTAVLNVINTGIPLAEAVYSAAEAPAAYLGILDKMKIAVGNNATFNVLNRDGSVRETYFKGNKVAK